MFMSVYLTVSLQKATTISSDKWIQLDVFRLFFSVIADLSAACRTQLFQMLL